MIKLFIPIKDQAIGLFAYKQLLDDLGVQLTANIKEADAVLPLTDKGAYVCVDHPRFMPKSSLEKLLNKQRLNETGLATLPTYLISESSLAPSGSLVKTANSVKGGYIYQPHLGFPQEDLDLSFSVNSRGELLEICSLHLTHEDKKKPTTIRNAEVEEKDEIFSLVQNSCNLLNITGGVHNVQFLKYNEEWCVIDWNPRPAFVHTEGLARLNPYMLRPLAFMLGLTIPDSETVYFNNKAFWNNPISFSSEEKIRALGLLPRKQIGFNGFVRVSGVSSDSDELEYKLRMLEE